MFVQDPNGILKLSLRRPTESIVLLPISDHLPAYQGLVYQLQYVSVKATTQ